MLDLYDRFAHGLSSRRQLIEPASKISAGKLSAAAILNALSPDYALANHGFHNDTTPRYDEDAAALAWQRTVEFFEKNLV